MMRWSCQRLHGCVPVDASASVERLRELVQLRLRSPMRAAASANDSQRPVRTSTSDAISSPTRCSSSAVPCAAACRSSKRFVELERLAVEDRELLLDGDGEVAAVLVRLERRTNLLVRAELLRVAHRRAYVTAASKPVCDAGPAPALDDGTARRLAELRALVVGQREQRCELVAQLGDVSVREAGERRTLGRILGLDSFGDLGEPRVARDERRHARGGGLGRDHPERLGEDRRHDGDVA